MSFLALLRAWLIILPLMIANGVLRELVLQRMIGSGPAEILSVAIALVIIFVLTRFLLHSLAGRPPAVLVRASATLVLLTVAFEFLFGHYVDGKTWAELVANYAIWQGHLWPLVLAGLAFTPFLWGRWALKESGHAR
jgi:hypothetical protein